MDRYEILQNAIDFCEANLNDEITMSKLAEMSGYSVYHFCRLFQQVIGCGPMEYLRKRRLTNAAVEIASNPGLIKDIGFAWGFNSHENFVRAFKSQFGIAPSQHRETQSSLNLFHKVNLREPCTGQLFKNNAPSPRYAAKPSFKLAGFCFPTSRCRVGT